MIYGGYFDIDSKNQRIKELDLEMLSEDDIVKMAEYIHQKQNHSMWNNQRELTNNHH